MKKIKKNRDFEYDYFPSILDTNLVKPALKSTSISRMFQMVRSEEKVKHGQSRSWYLCYIL